MPDITETTSKSPPDASPGPGFPDASTGLGLVERRRPGRRAHVSPELIPLLRGQITDAATADREAFINAAVHDASEGGQPAGEGILYGVLLSVPLWLISALIVRWLLRL